MVATEFQTLTAQKCCSCEGGLSKYSRSEAESQLRMLDGWQLSADGLRLKKRWITKDFMAGIDFFNRVALLAEEEGHHPDLHLDGYRHVTVELSTHAIAGLSDNDFIMAAKIDQLPIELRMPAL